MWFKWAIVIAKTVFTNLQEAARNAKKAKLFRLRERVKEHQRNKEEVP